MNASIVREIMTPDPLTIELNEPVAAAAKAMRDHDIGPVLVTEQGQLRGMLTDRDIVVRAVASGKDPQQCTVGEICTCDPVTVEVDAPVEQAIELMRREAIRRVPVVENNRPVGILSIGDLAIERDSDSALADISQAPPNN